MDLIFDLETDGLLDALTKIHCIWIEDVETGERVGYGPNMIDIARAGMRLRQADRIIGHNILKFDIPAINKVLDADLLPLTLDSVGTRFIDTMVCTRLLYADIAKDDKARGRNLGKLTGAHKLAAWGKRLGVLKGDYEGGWESWNQEMHDYCGQDVAVTRALYDRIQALNTDPRAVLLEHQFAFLMAEMEANGFGFNEQAAVDLYLGLKVQQGKLSDQLKEVFPPEEITTFTPKLRIPKTKLVEFNPSSRQMIGRRLMAKGWKPTEFTDNGQPKVDETILADLPYPEAKVLADYFLTEKRIGQIAEGDQAWLKVNKNGVIHGSINPNGAVTGRCTHSRPNISQVPKVGSPLGAECRACFRPTRAGWVQVGVDLSGLELRCLAHFMARYDGGAYGRILLEGDIHWANVLALGLAAGARDDSILEHRQARDKAKTFIYAFLYGAGNAKVASILGVSPTLGGKYKARFLRSLPALASLIEDVQAKAKAQGFLKGLDGRRLRVRSPHSALNTLLQSAGALIAKKATVLAYQNLHSRGVQWGHDWALMAHVHDEVQIECHPALADEVGDVVVKAMEEAGREFGLRIAITGEAHAGNNWAETH